MIRVERPARRTSRTTTAANPSTASESLSGWTTEAMNPGSESSAMNAFGGQPEEQELYGIGTGNSATSTAVGR